ncbi:MAG: tRNA 2-selenouridine(34) synthase MnmH [Herbaspirillum sp.]
MRYPALQTLVEILPRLDQFDSIIDTRSPAEFAQDHIPGAINCPVLNDEERARVGTLYQQVSQFEAKKIGAALVAHNIAHHIETCFQHHGHDWKPLIYCWRGGNRSAAMAHILARIGWPAIQLEGGYKAYRQHVLNALNTLPIEFEYHVICGPTGSGKSRLLQTMADNGAQVLDLEQLAVHRGSLLGHLPNQPQPSQKLFETRLWCALRGFNRSRPVYVESESKKVGNLQIPETLIKAMRAARCIDLQLAQEHRVQLLMQDYDYFVHDPASLNSQLEHLTYLHGREKVSEWQSLAANGQTQILVNDLLQRHYDPAYTRSIARNFIQFTEARKIQLPNITPAAFTKAAQTISNYTNSAITN